jgi:hypothetical protein
MSTFVWWLLLLAVARYVIWPKYSPGMMNDILSALVGGGGGGSASSGPTLAPPNPTGSDLIGSFGTPNPLGNLAPVASVSSSGLPSASALAASGPGKATPSPTPPSNLLDIARF